MVGSEPLLSTADQVRPDPRTAASISDYLHMLRRLRIWAGNPSLAVLSKRSGLARTTIHDALSPKRTALPSLELIRKLVIACGCSDPEVHRWAAVWRGLQERVSAGHAPPVPAPRHPTVPRQLPAETYGFVGREAELKKLEGILADWRDAEHPSTAIAVISGPGGVGKTSLALRWAHQIATHFPDGQLYLNLKGFSSQPPVSEAAALSALLGAIGIAADRIPVSLDAQVGLYRTVLSSRRMLIVLDNAADVGQVRPLLPGTASCFCLVTSRQALGGLVAREGARKLTVGGLDSVEARSLLVECLGAERVMGEEEAAAQLARLCGNLPLALRIAAANLIDRPQWTIEEYVAELAAGDRLRALTVDGDDEAAVSGVFLTSFAKLDRAARALFARLGVLPGEDFSREAAAVVSGDDVRAANRSLKILAAAHLVEPAHGERLRLHDLLRLFASQLATGDEGSAAALTRLLEWYLGTALSAVEMLRPDLLRLPAPAPRDPSALTFADVDQARTWLDDERSNLVAAIARAGQQPPLRHYCWLLTDALRAYFHLRVPLVDWVRAAEAGLAAARSADMSQAEAAMLASLGDAAQARDEFGEARTQFMAALEICERIGDQLRAAALKTNLGSVSFEAGDLEQAGLWRVAAIEDYRRLGDRAREAAALARLATLYRDQGKLDDAARCLEQAIESHRESGERYRLADATARLGIVLRHQGLLDQARECATRAMEIFEAVGDRPGKACTLEDRASALLEAGMPGPARDDARSALHLARELGDARIESEALITFGRAQHSLGVPHAAEHIAEALTLARQGGNIRCQINALIALAGVAAADGDVSEVHAYADEAVRIARRAHLKLLETRALAVAASTG